MNPDDFLPIKVVLPKDSDHLPPRPRPRDHKEFVAVTRDLRDKLTVEADTVAEHFQAHFKSKDPVPAVARVRLRPEAMAKSHRPTELFDSSTCPIIGGGSPGELLVSVRPGGLDELRRSLNGKDSKIIKANISTVESITPYSMFDALVDLGVDELLDAPADVKIPFKIRLFRHVRPFDDRSIDLQFIRLANQFGIEEITPLDYADGLKIIKANAEPEKLARLARFAFPGIQRLSRFPVFRFVKTMSRSIGKIDANVFPPPAEGVDYPLVGILDSGTDPKNEYLKPWIAHRLSKFDPIDEDNDHGTFVAGLIVHGRLLNHNHPGFPQASSKVVDVVVFDKDGQATEDELIFLLDEALDKFPQVRVWNLSLGQSDPCVNDVFSEFGAALDARAKKYNVQFVIAAGNYEDPPYRGWPPERSIGEADRICPPADAVHAITVGSIAHLENSNTRVGVGHPSPFSRRGPGPAYIAKPEISMIAGNCDENGRSTQTGVISINASKHIAEDIGTSFACPLASSLVANVISQLSVEGDAANSSTLVARSLLYHATFLANIGGNPDLIDYIGLGQPPSIDNIIGCSKSSATLLFEVPIKAGHTFVKADFPMPECLIGTDGLEAEIFMTLVYDPPLNQNGGIENCQCNVDASFGTLRPDKNGDFGHKKEVKNWPVDFEGSREQTLITHGYKWSPTKFYYRKFSKGPTSYKWRLALSMLARSGISIAQQKVALIISIRSTSGSEFVYDQLASLMASLQWNVQDLAIRSRVRQRNRRPLDRG